jgi:putative membrane protein
MAFIDDLALVEVFLMLTAAVLAYSGIRVWIALFRNQAAGLNKIIQGTAIPLGLVGAGTFALALWGEMTWPFPAAYGMTGYNIFFFDPLILMGFVLLAFAVSAYFSLRLSYVGVFGLVAGGVTIYYGWTGYTANPPFTLEPLYTFLLYAGFGLAAACALPTTMIVDWYRSSVEAGIVPWKITAPSTASTTVPMTRNMGTRAVQPVVPGTAPAEAPPAPPTSGSVFHMSYALQILVLVFPVVMALAGIAAFWFLGTTLPGHLGGGPAKGP